MKKLFYLVALIYSMSLFTACSDDDDEARSPITEMTDFHAGNGLALTSGGIQKSDVKVTFTPDAVDPTKAVLILTSYSGAPVGKGNTSTLGGMCVLPGSRTVTIPVVLDIRGREASFAGTGESEYCTFDYAGKVTKSSLQLDLTNVALKNNTLAGTVWMPTPFDPYDHAKKPIRIQWEAEKQPEVSLGSDVAIPFPMNIIVNMALQMDLIPVGEDKLMIPEMLCNVLKDITLCGDGNIMASYIDAAHGGTEVVGTPADVAQYVLLDDSHMKVYINLETILSGLTSATTKAGLEDAIGNAIKILVPLLDDGIPVRYKVSEGKLSAYLDTDLLLPILKEVVKPLFSDKEFVAGLMESMKSNPSFTDLAPMAEGVLNALPEVIDTTSSIEIGLNLDAK